MSLKTKLAPKGIWRYTKLPNTQTLSFSCMLCNFHTPFKANLKSQVRNKQTDDREKQKKGRIVLFCDQSGHLSTLNIRINSVHKGIIHKCEHCDYTAKTLSIVNSHIRQKHLGITFQPCDYKDGTKWNLNVHWLSKHLDIKLNCTFFKHFQTQFQGSLQ